MNARNHLPPLFLAALLAWPLGLADLFAQQVVLPPVEPVIETEIPADAEEEDAAAPTEVAAEPATDTLMPAEGEAPAAEPEPAGDEEPASEEEAVEVPSAGIGARPATTLPGGDPDAEMAPEEEEEEERELEPLPAPPINKEEDEFLPPSYSPERYRPTWSNSAFTREIVPEAVVADEIPNVFDKYVLTGVAKIGGAYVISSLNDKNEPTIIRTTPHEKTGLFVVSVDRADRMSDSKVRISDGKQSGEIAFDSKRLSAAPRGAIAGAVGNPAIQIGAGGVPAGRIGGGQPGQPGQPQPGAVPAGAVPAGAVNPQGGQPQAEVQMTPQQIQAQQQAQQQASAQLIEHLRSAAANPAAQGNPGQGDQPKRRRVVLPPSTNR